MLAEIEPALRSRVLRVVGRRKTVTALSMEARIEALLLRLRRRYGEFGEGMQRHIEQSFTRFVSRCETWLAVLRRMRLSGGQTT
jgi:CRP-like cAMP-binding protein